MGTVYKAEDLRLNRFVALKLLSGDAPHHSPRLAAFQHEAVAASALNHPNICTIYDIGEEHNQAFLAMQSCKQDLILKRSRIGLRIGLLRTALSHLQRIYDVVAIQISAEIYRLSVWRTNG